MDKRNEELLMKIRPERHISAMMTLANLKYIKEECERNKYCSTCKFGTKEDEKGLCNIIGNDVTPQDWDEYAITERMYK